MVRRKPTVVWVDNVVGAGVSHRAHHLRCQVATVASTVTNTVIITFHRDVKFLSKSTSINKFKFIVLN